jgi:hypothetical protein
VYTTTLTQPPPPPTPEPPQPEFQTTKHKQHKSSSSGAKKYSSPRFFRGWEDHLAPQQPRSSSKPSNHKHQHHHQQNLGNTTVISLSKDPEATVTVTVNKRNGARLHRRVQLGKNFVPRPKERVQGWLKMVSEPDGSVVGQFNDYGIELN